MTTSVIIFLTILIWTSATFAFNTDYSSPRQCSPFHVNFTGIATPPFRLFLIPLGGTPICVDLPSSAWDERTQTGSFETTLSFLAGQRFIATMDDGNGRGTGGVSAVMEVAPSEASCHVESSNSSLFDLSPPVPMQCSPLSITWPNSTVNPPTIRGFVPSGSPFGLDPPTASAPPNTNVWRVDVPAGTDFVLMVGDEDGAFQSSDLLTVASSPDRSCFSNDSPSVTIAAAGVLATNTMSGTSFMNGPSATAPVAATKPNLGIVAGAITAGAVVGILLLFALFIYIQRRRVQVQRSQRRPDLLPEAQAAPPVVTIPSYMRPSTASSTSSSEAPVSKRKNSMAVLTAILPFTRPRTADSESRRTAPPMSMSSSFGNRGPLPASPPRPVVMPAAFRAEPDDDLDNNRGVTFLYSGGPGLDEPVSPRRQTADDSPPRYNTVVAPASSRPAQAVVHNGAKRR